MKMLLLDYSCCIKLASSSCLGLLWISLLCSYLLYICDRMWLFLDLDLRGLLQLGWYSKKNKDNAFRLSPCVIVCVIIQQAEWKTHFTVTALQANDAHSYMAAKKHSSIFANPLCHVSGGLPSDHLWSSVFFFPRSIVPLLIFFNLRRKVVLLHLGCGEFFFFFFIVKCFQFHLVIFSYLIQGGIWNTQVLLSHVVSLALQSEP